MITSFFVRCCLRLKRTFRHPWWSQVTNSPSGDHTFDAHGNMTAEAPVTSTARHFTYDDKNQLTERVRA